MVVVVVAPHNVEVGANIAIVSLSCACAFVACHTKRREERRGFVVFFWLPSLLLLALSRLLASGKKCVRGANVCLVSFFFRVRGRACVCIVARSLK